MAIVDMNRLSVIGLNEQKKDVLNLLMKFGFVEIDKTDKISDDEDINVNFKNELKTSEISDTEQKIYQTELALGLLKKKTKYKKGLLSVKDDYVALTDKEAEDLYESVLKINGLEKQIAEEKNRINTKTNSINALKPWEKFDIPLDSLKTRNSKIILGTFPISVKVQALNDEFLKENIASSIYEIDADKTTRFVFIISHNGDFDRVTEFLRAYEFNTVTFTDLNGKVSKNISLLNEEIKKSNEKISETEKEIISFGHLIKKFEMLTDSLMILSDKLKADESLLTSKSAFILKGYVPTKKADELVNKLNEKFICHTETEKASPDEDFPILLENNSIVTPFESVTKMFSTPNPKDLDPTPIMTIFYIIFFGMMLADGGYGLLMSIICFIVVKKMKLRKGTGNLIKLIGICGLSTSAWGFIFGSFFGFEVPGLINPLTDVMLLMGMSLLFGILQIFVGLGMKGYLYIKQKDYMSFFSETILWYFLLTGLCILIVPIVAGDIGPLATVGKYLAIIGAVGVVLTAGRAQKNIFKRLFKGVSGLYDIVSYFGDILSYTRLMALCLSSAVIAQVVNILGGMMGPIPFFFIGLIGHAINLGINALGAYVHTSRLQFVEFFGKFFEGGGKNFTPFRKNVKYTNINE